MDPESQVPLPVQSRPPHCCQTGMALTVAAKTAAEVRNCFMVAEWPLSCGSQVVGPCFLHTFTMRIQSLYTVFQILITTTRRSTNYRRPGGPYLLRVLIWFLVSQHAMAPWQAICSSYEILALQVGQAQCGMAVQRLCHFRELVQYGNLDWRFKAARGVWLDHGVQGQCRKCDLVLICSLSLGTCITFEAQFLNDYIDVPDRSSRTTCPMGLGAVEMSNRTLTEFVGLARTWDCGMFCGRWKSR